MEHDLGQRDVKEQGQEHSDDQHGSESLEDVGSHGEEDESDQSGAYLTVPDSRPAPIFRMIYRSRYALAFRELFAQSFVHQDVRIHSHSYGKDDDRDTAER